MCITLLQCLEYPGYKFLMSNKLNKAEFSSAIGPNSPGMWSEFSKAIRPNSLLVQNPVLVYNLSLFYVSVIIFYRQNSLFFLLLHILINCMETQS